MGDMFRSEKMSLCQLFLQPEAAYASISELGEAGCAQFHDLNAGVSAFQRRFVAEVRRCDELERKMVYIEEEIKKDGIKLPEIDENLPRAPHPREIIELESQLERAETEILELAANAINLKTNFLELTELCMVLENTDEFFSDQEVINLDSHTGKTAADCSGLGSIAGVVRRERVFAFERMLWRMSRGNIFLRHTYLEEPLKDPRTGDPIYKTVFVVFFQGEHLKNRIKKVCTGFHATMYPCPSSHAERVDMHRGVRIRLEDLKLVLSQTIDHRSRVLAAIFQNIPMWSVMIKKMKAIYHTLNMFSMDVTEKCLIGECWVPAKDVPIVQQSLSDGSAAVGSTVQSFLNVIETNKEPPTYFRINKFTRGFQNLIDAYGVATYREVNPALYTCITFPFLFGVMFGDMGHGLILVLFGAWMVICEEKLSKKRGGGEIWNIFFVGRYIILLMGLFACYTGFTYNDIFSKSLNVFGSTWRIHYNTSTVMSNNMLQLHPNYSTNGVYPIGIDPIWQDAENKIIFLNTYKMKLSIIIGVIHMLFGVCLSVVNYSHFRNYYNIILQFVPQVIFLTALFGYMVFMMFFKFFKYSPKTSYQPDTPGCAPSVLILFINMMLFHPMEPLKGCDPYMFTFQPTLEKILVVVALICIPWMLLGKPLYIKFTRRNKVKEIDVTVVNVDLPNGEMSTTTVGETDGGDADEEPMSEIYIHQAIHTIEYVLSTISHTASYLRLWALSLAHAQLSEVLWTMVMRIGLKFGGFVGSIPLFFIFGAWTLFTIAILVVMEGLSAFLHTLRLHWVEFMSKFYEGAGYAFEPFSFKVILNEEEED